MEVIRGLYLGTYFQATDVDLINRLNITHIVNLSQIPFTHPSLHILEVPVSDDETTNIKKYFNQVSKFIVSGLQEGNVLVNCHMATSRSPAFVIAFLMRKRQMSLVDAHNLVISVNRHVYINEGFWKQLQEYFTELSQGYERKMTLLNESKST